MKLILRIFSIIALWGSLSLPAMALEPVYSDFFGKAIKGFDPVAYFTQSKPVRGDDDYTYRWNNAKWYFSSAQNRDAFAQNPEKYAPQYGGYCAWAVSQGYTAKIDPDAWHIHQGKLYLNYNKSVQKKWQRDVPGHIAQGDKNWPSLLAEN